MPTLRTGAAAFGIGKNAVRGHLLALVDLGEVYEDEGRYVPVDLGAIERAPQARSEREQEGKLLAPRVARWHGDEPTPPASPAMQRRAA